MKLPPMKRRKTKTAAAVWPCDTGHPEGHPFRVREAGKEWVYFETQEMGAFPLVRNLPDLAHIADSKTYEAFACLALGTRFQGSRTRLDRAAARCLQWSHCTNTEMRKISAGIRWTPTRTLELPCAPRSRYAGSGVTRRRCWRWTMALKPRRNRLCRFPHKLLSALPSRQWSRRRRFALVR